MRHVYQFVITVMACVRSVVCASVISLGISRVRFCSPMFAPSKVHHKYTNECK